MAQQNSPLPIETKLVRKDQALAQRIRAANVAQGEELTTHEHNGEEHLYGQNDQRGTDERCFTNFTKGLPHDENGFVQSGQEFQGFANTIRDANSADKVGDLNAQFEIGNDDWLFYGQEQAVYNAPSDDTSQQDTTFILEDQPDETQYRRWEAPTAGLVFDSQGPDAMAVSMPPAPTVVIKDINGQTIANPELVAEMVEVYWLSLLRDVSFRAFDTITASPDDGMVEKAVKYLQSLPFYKASEAGHAGPRGRQAGPNGFDRNAIFRGQAPKELAGPYLSQFLLLGTPALDNTSAFREESYKRGKVPYGSLDIDLRVRQATEGKDYMTNWHEWLDIQNGANVRDAMQTYVPVADDNGYRFISTPRDLATYVHFDALYEAYLNACLTLLALGAPVDPGFKDLNMSETVEGFALWGGPHILTLVTEVATRALKAVRFQKFNVHMRARPEVLAARVAYLLHSRASGIDPDDAATMPLFFEHVGLLADALMEEQPVGDNESINLLEKVAHHNANQNVRHAEYLAQESGIAQGANLPLLPMAFAEGSPMHPAYGAGHATVAGACVTMLKAFFDTDSYIVWENAEAGQNRKIKIVAQSEYDASPDKYTAVAFVPSEDGSTIEDVGEELVIPLTLEGELNKLASNISIGRNMAGVHYYSDYIDSLRMGEAITAGILNEQALMYRNDIFEVSFPAFDDGKKVTIPAQASIVADDRRAALDAAESLLAAALHVGI